MNVTTKLAGLGAAAIMFLSTVSLAEPEAFTFNSTFETEVSVGAELPDGTTLSALSGRGTAEIRYTGSPDPATSACVAWSEPDESEFDIRYLCNWVRNCSDLHPVSHFQNVGWYRRGSLPDPCPNVHC